MQNATSGPAAVDRLDRDVLGLSGLTHVIWLEGINDLGAGYGQAASATPVYEDPVVHTPENIIVGYQNMDNRLHARSIKVCGGTIISALGMNNPDEGWDLNNFPEFLASVDNGPVIDGYRKQINAYIRTAGLFDGVVDFERAAVDAATGNIQAAYLPNSQFTQLKSDLPAPQSRGLQRDGSRGRYRSVRGPLVSPSNVARAVAVPACAARAATSPSTASDFPLPRRF